MTIEKTDWAAMQQATTYLFATKDYGVELITLSQSEAPHPAVLRKYAVVHKVHRVVGAIGEQFHAAIDIANALQEQHDQAIAGREPPGSVPVRRPNGPPVLS